MAFSLSPTKQLDYYENKELQKLYKVAVTQVQQYKQQYEEINVAYIEQAKQLKLLNEKLSLLEKEVQSQNKNVPMQDEAMEEIPNSNGKKVEYCTNSSELSYETGWARVINKKKLNKKRKAESSVEHSPGESPATKQKPVPKRMPIPPPIMVSGTEKIAELREILLSKIPKEDLQMKIIGNDDKPRVKINTRSGEEYRDVTGTLNDGQYQWHSYEDKQQRPIRVMARNLYHTYKSEDIVADLKDQGLMIQSAVNKIGYKKGPLNMFILSFSNEEDINKVYGIKAILNMRVTIEALKNNKLIPQCKRCQGYAHTQKYCHREPRCVKCAGPHLTSDCNLQSKDKPQCFHCGEHHVASYRGCLVAIELQNIKNKQIKRQTTLRTTGKSYAQVLTASASENNKKSEQKQNTEQSQNINNTLQLILKQLNSFDERLKQLENKSKGAIPKTSK